MIITVRQVLWNSRSETARDTSTANTMKQPLSGLDPPFEQLSRVCMISVS